MSRQMLLGGGVNGAAGLAVASMGTLERLGIKKGTRIKIDIWQKALLESPQTTPAPPPPDPPPSAPLAPAAPAAAPQGQGGWDALTAVVLGPCKGTQGILELLRAGGVTSVAGLMEQTEATLAALGIKKGPRLKIMLYLNGDT